MTRENLTTTLLILAQFIAQLIAPALGELIKKLFTPRPKPEPDASQPPSLTQPKSGWFMRVARSPWILPPFFMVLDTGLLLNEFRSRAPITRMVIFNLATLAVGIWCNFFMMALNLVQQRLTQQGEATVAGFKKIAEGLQGLTTELTNKVAVRKEREEATVAGFKKIAETLQGLNTELTNKLAVRKERGKVRKR
jgi:hypothetical protein